MTAHHIGHGDGSGHADHDAHAHHSPEIFRDRFWLSLLLTIPTLVWSDLLQDWFSYTAPRTGATIRVIGMSIPHEPGRPWSRAEC